MSETQAADQTFADSWIAEIYKRLLHLWWLKASGSTAFMLIFFYSYFALLRAPISPVVTMPTTWVDDWIVFTPSWFYTYASLWLYTVLVPALQPSALRFFGYGCGIGLLCLSGLVCFLFFPSTIPYASMDWFHDPALSILHRVDLAGNACPSLHVATALFSAICLHRLFFTIGCPRWVSHLSWLWCLLIVYSTMAIKQHVMWDVVFGAVLALVWGGIYIKFEDKLIASENAKQN